MIGPGLGGDEGVLRVADIMNAAEVRSYAIVDADGLFLVARDPE